MNQCRIETATLSSSPYFSRGEEMPFDPRSMGKAITILKILFSHKLKNLRKI
jgi:hypothetical protein